MYIRLIINQLIYISGCCSWQSYFQKATKYATYENLITC